VLRRQNTQNSHEEFGVTDELGAVLFGHFVKVNLQKFFGFDRYGSFPCFIVVHILWRDFWDEFENNSDHMVCCFSVQRVDHRPHFVVPGDVGQNQLLEPPDFLKQSVFKIAHDWLGIDTDNTFAGLLFVVTLCHEKKLAAIGSSWQKKCVLMSNKAPDSAAWLPSSRP
jgi:hypothetical protein